MVTESLVEAKLVKIKNRRIEAVLYQNPTRSDIIGLIKRMPIIRGMTNGQMIYVWDAHEFTHAMMIEMIRKEADPEFDCSIYDFGKMFIIMGDTPKDYAAIGGEWVNDAKMSITDDILIYAEHFDQLDSIPAFLRMVGSRSQSDEETTPASA